MKRKRVFILVPSVLLAILIVALFLIPRSIRNFFYPTAKPMPPVVNISMAEILKKLEVLMQDKAPAVLAELQTGLSDSEISALESKSGVQLPDDMKALYHWRNGSGNRNPMLCGPIPGHRFLPLNEALGLNSVITNQLAGASGVQRAAFEVFAGHAKSWIPLFDDGAGDGYFFDPKRKASEGAVFYHFAEDASYVFFPSIKNLIAGTVKCYEQDAFAWKTNGNATGLTQDFERSQKIWQEFGSDNTQ
jgi:cell wall assembly regulator SMI1